MIPITCLTGCDDLARNLIEFEEMITQNNRVVVAVMAQLNSTPPPHARLLIFELYSNSPFIKLKDFSLKLSFSQGIFSFYFRTNQKFI